MQPEIKPMYSLQAIDLLLRNALNYGMSNELFNVECNASSGFRVTFQNKEKDYYEVVNTNSYVMIHSQPLFETAKLVLQFSEVNNNIYSFKPSFDNWLRTLYMIQKRKIDLKK
jgi:hypothetical protein